LFVGSYALADEPGIFAFTLDEWNAELRAEGGVAGIRNPSFLGLRPGGNHLFAVSETGLTVDGVHGAVHGFRIDRRPGSCELVALNHRSTAGDHPCHLGFDASGRWMAASNYGSGSVVIFPIAPDGVLGPMTSLVEHSGTGPNTDRQEGPHAHSTIFTPNNRFLVVADLGIDRLVIYNFDDEAGSLDPHSEVKTSPGAGPRHMAFHPDGSHLLVVNELANSITLYRHNATTGGLRHVRTLSTVPPGAPQTTAADVRISETGGHVYVSNRGDNSIAVFTFDTPAGLTRSEVRPSGGEWPRNFGLTPGGRHLIVANRYSNEIVLLPLLDHGADIGEPVVRAEVSQPSCVTFV